MTSARSRRLRQPARGLSIIEAMVGLVVGLLVSLTAAKSAQWFTATQRQGVGVGGGSANAASALAAIKEDLATGGMGFFADGGYRCSSLNLSVGTSVVADGAAFFPIQATRSGSNDMVDVVYASDVAAGAWTQLTEVSDGTSATLKSMLPVTVAQNTTVLLAPKDVGTPCLVRSTTASAAPTAATKQVLTFGSTGQYNQGVFTTPPTLREGAPVMMIGNLQWNRYALDGTNLVLTRMLTGTSATLLRNVIGFRVQYGVAAAGATTLEASWPNTDTAGWSTITAANAARVRALRIGVLLRSPQREKGEGTNGACLTTTTKPKLFEGTADEVQIEPDVTDWQCYRYRSAVIVAPIRNLVQGTAAIAWPQTAL